MNNCSKLNMLKMYKQIDLHLREQFIKQNPHFGTNLQLHAYKQVEILNLSIATNCHQLLHISIIGYNVELNPTYGENIISLFFSLCMFIVHVYTTFFKVGMVFHIQVKCNTLNVQPTFKINELCNVCNIYIEYISPLLY